MEKTLLTARVFRNCRAFYFLVTILKLKFYAIWTVVCHLGQLSPQGLSNIQNGGTRCKILRHFEYRKDSGEGVGFGDIEKSKAAAGKNK